MLERDRAICTGWRFDLNNSEVRLIIRIIIAKIQALRLRRDKPRAKIIRTNPVNIAVASAVPFKKMGKRLSSLLTGARILRETFASMSKSPTKNVMRPIHTGTQR